MPVTTITFPGGIDESVRSELVDPAARLLQSQNAYQETRGSLQKPVGSRSLTATRLDATTISAGYALMSHGDSIVSAADSYRLNAYSEAVSRWVEKYAPSEASVRRIAMPFAGNQANYVDIAYCNGYIVYVTTGPSTPGGSDNVVASIVDATTMQPVRVDMVVSGVVGFVGCKLAVFTTSNKVAMVYGRTGTTLSGRTVDLTSATTVATGWSAATDLATTFAAPGATELSTRFDIACSGATLGLIFTNNTAGPSYLTLNSFTDAFASLNGPASYGLSSAASSKVAIAAKDTSSGVRTFWAAWDEGAGSVNVHVGSFDHDVQVELTNVSVITTMAACSAIGLVGITTTTGRVSATDPNLALRTRAFTTSGTDVATSGSTATYFNIKPMSRPFLVGSVVYQQVNSLDGNGAPGNFVVLLDEGVGTLRPVANIASELASFNPAAHVHVAAISALKFALVNTVQRQSRIDVDALAAYANEIAVLDYGSPLRFLSSHMGPSTFLSGATSTYFDGVHVRETNFLHPPKTPAVSSSGTGFTITNGARAVAVFESVDAQGNVEWSYPSDPSSVFTGANKTYNFALTTLSLTAKYDSNNQGNKVQIAVYVTADNGGIGPYYRQGTIANDYTATTVTFSLGVQITTTSATLYTNPGAVGTTLGRQAPPASLHQFAHGDRLVVLADDGESVFYSGPRVIGEQIWFSALQQFPVSGAGPNVAGWSQDGRMVIAKEAELYAIDGDGPPENGGNGTEFSLPRRISSDAGCVEPRSICTTVLGTFFRSRRGIEILDRGFGVQWIGEPVQVTLATYPIVTSAVLDSEKAHVIFTLAAAETNHQVSGGGVILVYDLATKSWFARDSHATGWQSACMATVSGKPRYHALGSTGLVYRERLPTDGGSYLLNAATWRAQQATTGWIKLAGLSGNAIIRKVQLLGKRLTDHDLTVEVGFNDRSTWDQSRAYTRAEIAGLTADGEHLEVVIGNECRCRTVRFRLTDATPTGGTVGTGQGAVWYGILVHYDLDGSETFRRPGAAR